MKRRFGGRKNYPTDEIDPENFYDDDKIKELTKSQKNFKFSQEDYKKLYNCVHCGECKTENERIQLKQKFLGDGNTVEGLKEMKEGREKPDEDLEEKEEKDEEEAEVL